MYYRQSMEVIMIEVSLKNKYGRIVKHSFETQTGAFGFIDNRAANDRDLLREIECSSLALKWILNEETHEWE
jgi:hypothetical protein